MLFRSRNRLIKTFSDGTVVACGANGLAQCCHSVLMEKH